MSIAPITAAIASKQKFGRFVWSDRAKLALENVVDALIRNIKLYKVRSGPDYDFHMYHICQLDTSAGSGLHPVQYLHQNFQNLAQMIYT